MPRESVWMIRLALIYMLGGSLLGAMLLAGKGMALPSWFFLLRQGHIEILLFGFMVQLAFGVAWWILPRTSARPATWRVILPVVLLNAGLWHVALSPLLPGGGLDLAGRVYQTVAIVAFIQIVWPRVRAVVRH
jgi:hypothetical protein